MRPRPAIEVLVVLGITGLLLELAAGYTWVLVAAGAATAVWLLARSH
jgi:hypothetical protein